MPAMEERRRLWKKFIALRPERAMILVFPEGSWREINADQHLACEDAEAAAARAPCGHPLIAPDMDTDMPVERTFFTGKAITSTGWGLEAKWHWASEETGADLRSGHPRALRPQETPRPEIRHDAAATHGTFEPYHDTFGDILDVRPRGMSHIGFGLMDIYTSFRGLEQVMLDMYEQPGMIHEAMTILTGGYQGMIRQSLELVFWTSIMTTPTTTPAG